MFEARVLVDKKIKNHDYKGLQTVNRLNPSCLHDLFTKNEVVYDMRTQKLE